MTNNNASSSNSTDPVATTWQQGLSMLLHPRVATMLFLGFSAGVPILLIFSSLSLWLREAGVERAAVTFFSWAALGYSFKFIWAPLIDQLPVPHLTKLLGRRRAWLLVSQLLVIVSIAIMASVDPASASDALTMMAVGAVMLGFSSATQDIVIDAYRIESAPMNLQAMMSSTYIAGYRIGMVIAGAGALYLADYFGSTKETYNYGAWQTTYLIMAATMLVGVVTTCVISEPQVAVTQDAERTASSALSGAENVRILGVFVVGVASFIALFGLVGDVADGLRAQRSVGPLLSFVLESARLLVSLGGAVLVGSALVKLGIAPVSLAKRTWLAPVNDFFQRYGHSTAWLVLALIGLYRISDIVLGVISNVFYQDMGFSKPEIAAAVKTYGVLIGIAGSVLGGIVATRVGVMRTLMWGALLSALTNLAFVALAMAGHDVAMMYAVVSADNLAAGFASAAFVAFLSSLTNVSFTAVQYAIFSSLMTLLPKTLGGYSGGMVEVWGYPYFFVLTTIIGLPVLWLVHMAGKRLAVKT
ncbi:MAG: MFS transporter [Burkholderiaceae bacterium]|jgi:PAT family beta-lactamase induction signal transducer AmpG